MNCIKCGRAAKSPQVFCDECLEDMKAYPVNPNVTVQIPVRPEPVPEKKRARMKKYVKPEDKVHSLQSHLRLVTLAWIVTLLAFAVTAYMMLRLLQEGKDPEPAPQAGIVTEFNCF